MRASKSVPEARRVGRIELLGGSPLLDPEFKENSACHGRGEAGVDWELAMLGKESKWCSAGDEIADRVSIKDDMTSVDAGSTTTWFDDRRLT